MKELTKNSIKKAKKVTKNLSLGDAATLSKGKANEMQKGMHNMRNLFKKNAAAERKNRCY